MLELEQNERFEVESANNQSAFELFVQSMKASGQLPEKPAPVVLRLYFVLYYWSTMCHIVTLCIIISAVLQIVF